MCICRSSSLLLFKYLFLSFELLIIFLLSVIIIHVTLLPLIYFFHRNLTELEKSSFYYSHQLFMKVRYPCFNCVRVLKMFYMISKIQIDTIGLWGIFPTSNLVDQASKKIPIKNIFQSFTPALKSLIKITSKSCMAILIPNACNRWFVKKNLSTSFAFLDSVLHRNLLLMIF